MKIFQTGTRPASRMDGRLSVSTKVMPGKQPISKVDYRPSSSDQAFIYLLEAWAAMLAPVICEPWPDDFYIHCCDSQASRHALIKGLKGVCKHQPLNCMVAAHYTWHNRRGIAHRFE